MAMILTAAPAREPVTLDEAKAHLRVDGSDEDVLIASLITAARVHVEAALSRALITQGWTLLLDTWPHGPVQFPIAPLQTVDEVRVLDALGSPTIVAPADYFVDSAGNPPRLVRESGVAWPQPGQVANGIEIDFTAGEGPTGADIAPSLRQAVLLLVAHWYETREPVLASQSVITVPISVGALMAPYRGMRL